MLSLAVDTYSASTSQTGVSSSYVTALNGLFIVTIATIGGAQYLNSLHKSEIKSIHRDVKSIVKKISKNYRLERNNNVETYDDLKAQVESLCSEKPQRSMYIVYFGFTILLAGMILLVGMICVPNNANWPLIFEGYGFFPVLLSLLFLHRIFTMSQYKGELHQKSRTLITKIEQTASIWEAQRKS